MSHENFFSLRSFSYLLSFFALSIAAFRSSDEPLCQPGSCGARDLTSCACDIRCQDARQGFLLSCTLSQGSQLTLHHLSPFYTLHSLAALCLIIHTPNKSFHNFSHGQQLLLSQPFADQLQVHWRISVLLRPALIPELSVHSILVTQDVWRILIPSICRRNLCDWEHHTRQICSIEHSSVTPVLAFVVCRSQGSVDWTQQSVDACFPPLQRKCRSQAITQGVELPGLLDGVTRSESCVKVEVYSSAPSRKYAVLIHLSRELVDRLFERALDGWVRRDCPVMPQDSNPELLRQSLRGFVSPWQINKTGLKVPRLPQPPQKPLGPRILPPISVPIPKGEPRIATRADSPPELPPEVRLVLKGFVVRPKRFECVSRAIRIKASPELGASAQEIKPEVADSNMMSARQSLDKMSMSWCGCTKGYPQLVVQ
ncbi:fatty-acid amide hydrolase, partial [Aureobasidium melanogenum]